MGSRVVGQKHGTKVGPGVRDPQKHMYGECVPLKSLVEKFPSRAPVPTGTARRGGSSQVNHEGFFPWEWGWAGPIW